MSPDNKTLSRSRLIIFTGLTALLGLMAGEAILRMVGYAPPITPYTNVSDIHHIHKSNWTGEHEGKRLTTNAWGLRDDEFPIEKPDGEQRILCIGDSVTFGHGVANGEDYPAQLESILNGRGEKSTRYQVINAGVCAYTPREEVEYYIRRGARFSPDKVVMGICLNDVTETNVPLHVPGKKLFKKSAYFFLLKDIRRRMVTRDIKQRDKKIYGLRDDVTKNETTPETEKSWQLVFDQVRRLKEAMGPKAETGLLVVLFPVQSQLKSGESGPQDRVGRFCIEEGIKFADPLPMLKELEGKLYIDEIHFNAKGCASIAQWLAGAL